jgi:hypothetical protein
MFEGHFLICASVCFKHNFRKTLIFLEIIVEFENIKNGLIQACKRELFCVGFLPHPPPFLPKPTHERGTKMTHFYKPGLICISKIMPMPRLIASALF